MARTIDEPWKEIFRFHSIGDHDFSIEPYEISALEIKEATREFEQVGQREVRILCKQDTRESRPEVFKDLGLFILPVRNGRYVIVKGEGYFDIPDVSVSPIEYASKMDFELDTATVGNSEMQHLDYAYATSLVRTFLEDNSLVLTIRGRKYTPEFTFNVNKFKITAESVQTEVDAGYEGREQVVLIEAKSSGAENTIIRQLFYPFRQWQSYTKKTVIPLFFEKGEDIYSLWMFEFKDPSNYNSIKLMKSACFKING